MSRSHRYPISCVLLAAALVALAPAPARALHASGVSDPVQLLAPGAAVSFSLGATVGVVEGSATELAIYYPYGQKFKLSELTWDLKDVVIGGVQGTVGIGRRFRLDFGVWSALSEGTGTMVDRDWNYPDGVSAFLEPNDHNWTDESRHPDTTVDAGVILDQNVSVTALQAGAFSLRGILGFKYDTWKWSSRGGTYTYSREYPGSRDATGNFRSGEEVITYEQKYSIPYLGVGANWAWPAFQVEAHLLYSGWVFASDSDYHVLRDLTFVGDFEGGTYVGLGVKASRAFTPRWSATLGAEYQLIPEITGDVTISGSENTWFFAEGGGIAMRALAVALGAAYRF